MLNLEYNPAKDLITVIGDNGSGKTTLITKLFTTYNNCFIINTSRQKIWSSFVNPENIINPVSFDLKWLEEVLLRISSKSKGKTTIILDDVDNFPIKGSAVFKSIVINARHLNIGIIVAARVLSDLPKIFYKQSRYIIIGSQSSDYDMYYLATVIGYGNARLLKELKEYEFAVWDSKQKKLSFLKLRL